MGELGAGSGSSYPTTLDTDSSVEVNDGGAAPTLARAEVVNDLADAIVKIETELGANPSGVYATVAARLTALGTIVKVVNTQTGAVATGSTVMPFDDTIPQNTEGDEYMTLAITPASASNLLKIDVVAIASNSYAGAHALIAALFQDTTANGLAVGIQYSAAAQYVMGIHFTHWMTAGTASETTFKVRIGGNQAGTTTFNGTGGNRIFGAKAASSITITEIAA